MPHWTNLIFNNVLQVLVSLHQLLVIAKLESEAARDMNRSVGQIQFPFCRCSLRVKHLLLCLSAFPSYYFWSSTNCLTSILMFSYSTSEPVIFQYRESNPLVISHSHSSWFNYWKIHAPWNETKERFLTTSCVCKPPIYWASDNAHCLSTQGINYAEKTSQFQTFLLRVSRLRKRADPQTILSTVLVGRHHILMNSAATSKIWNLRKSEYSSFRPFETSGRASDFVDIPLGLYS